MNARWFVGAAAVGIAAIGIGAYQLGLGAREPAPERHQQPQPVSPRVAGSGADVDWLPPGGQAGARTPRAGGVRALTSANSVKLAPRNRGQCRAFAPADWRILGVSPRGDVGELVSGDGRSYAGWSVRGVNRAMEPYFGALYGDPLASSQFLLAKAGEAVGDRTGFSPAGGPTRFGDEYVAQELRSATSRAVIVYRLYPATGMFSPGSYVISLRIAIAPLGAGDFALKTATGVAGSIDCSVVFSPPSNSDVPLPRPGDVHDRQRRAEDDDLADYNAQLGTQTFHSPTTGENVLVARDAAWTDGPEGEGVYRRVGNSYEKLTPGRAP